jgi:hypothetical protein
MDNENVLGYKLRLYVNQCCGTFPWEVWGRLVTFVHSFRVHGSSLENEEQKFLSSQRGSSFINGLRHKSNSSIAWWSFAFNEGTNESYVHMNLIRFILARHTYNITKITQFRPVWLLKLLLLHILVPWHVSVTTILSETTITVYALTFKIYTHTQYL